MSSVIASKRERITGPIPATFQLHGLIILVLTSSHRRRYAEIDPVVVQPVA